MEGPDNIMSILKSITPIKFKFSKKNKQLDKTFKSMSLQNLIRNLEYHPKIKDEFTPAPEFLNNKNKHEINFKNSNQYIRELSDLNNLPIIINNKNFLKKGEFNPDFDINPLNNNQEKKKIMEEKERRKKERLEERLKKLKFWKESDSNIDSFKYNPNYDFIRKKVFSVRIRPPTVKKIKKTQVENEKNEDKKKIDDIKNNNTINQNFNEQNQNINENNQNNEINQNQSVITFDKNKNDMNIRKSSTNSRNSQIIKENMMNNFNNNSLIYNDSPTNNSNSSKIQYSNNNLSSKSLTRNETAKKIRMMNLKNRIKMFERKSSTNSDYNTYDINKSTNLDDLSLMYQEREKLSSIHSMRNISNKNIYLPKIQKKLQPKSLRNKNKRNKAIKYSINFKKMLGRKDELFGDQSLNLISYFPNYDFFMPHIPTIIFKHHKNDDELKKYITGKIIRGYKYSPEKYFVFEYKKYKSKRLNLIRERQKIIEILKEKIEE